MGSETLLQQSPPVVNWLIQIVPYNCCKTVIVVYILDYEALIFYYLFMVALCNRADHYIFILFLLLLSSSSFFFFPRLILAVGDWMFTILWYMVWP